MSDFLHLCLVLSVIPMVIHLVRIVETAARHMTETADETMERWHRERNKLK